MKVLVDTGAQVDLVNERLVPQDCAKEAKNPVRLIAANGERLSGGKKSVELELCFQSRTR